MRHNLATVLLEVEHLSLACRGEIMLSDISFSLAGGDILSLLGPSGSGKTTLLRLLAGLETPDQGKIIFNEQDMADIPAHRRAVGMMFQDYALFPHMNVRENVSYGLQVQWKTARGFYQRVIEILKMVGLEGYEDRRIDSLSGGERQRVALARSLAPEPRLLLLDEPLAALDRSLRDRLADEIRSILKALGITTIFVTHDQSEAFAVADRIAILHEGRLEQFGLPEEVYRNPINQTVATFLGFHNLLAARRDGKGTTFSALGNLQGVSTPDGSGQTGWLLIRPDGARLLSQGDFATSGLILSGTVNRRQFQGRSYHLAIETKGQNVIFDLPLDPCPPGIGESIMLDLKLESMRWLPDSLRTV